MPGRHSFRSPAVQAGKLQGVLPALSLFILLAAVYLWSAPRTVVLEDDGYFILAAYFGTGAHPPGYPLFTLLGHLASKIPFGSVAFRIHGLNAVFGALAVVALWRLCRMLLNDQAAALAAALAFGFSSTFWSQSIIAEVYALNVLLFVSLAIIALAWARNPALRHGTVALAAGCLYGLSLSNHWPLMLLSTPALLLLTVPGSRELLARWPAVLAGLLAGLLPYLWLIHRMRVVPEFSFYGPIEDASDFWFFVSREGYAAIDHSPTAGWQDKLLFSGFVLRQVAVQFGPFGALLALLGLARQWRVWPRSVCWGLVAGFAGSTFVLAALLGFDFDGLHRIEFRVFPLVSYGVAAVWLGLGVREVVGWSARRAGRHVRPGVLGGALVMLLAGTLGLANAPDNYRARDVWAEDYARAVLDTLPADAVLYANADTVNGPVGYLHWVLGERPDVVLQNGHSFLFGGRLYRPYLLAGRALRRLFNDYIRSSARPIFYANDFPHDFSADDYGLYFRADPSPEAKSRMIADPRIVAFFERITRGMEPRDPMAQIHYRLLRADYCRLWAGVHADGLASALQRGVPEPCNHFHGRLLLLERLLRLDSGEPAVIRSLLDEARRLQGQAVFREDAVWLQSLSSRIPDWSESPAR